MDRRNFCHFWLATTEVDQEGTGYAELSSAKQTTNISLSPDVCVTASHRPRVAPRFDSFAPSERLSREKKRLSVPRRLPHLFLDRLGSFTATVALHGVKKLSGTFWYYCYAAVA